MRRLQGNRRRRGVQQLSTVIARSAQSKKTVSIAKPNPTR